jgi:hypothetical protein
LPDWRITCFFVGRTHRHRGDVRTARIRPLPADWQISLGGQQACLTAWWPSVARA